MKGSYNAITQEASGEVTRTDYQEGRKTTLLNFGLGVAFLAILAGLAWLIISKLTSTVPDPITALKEQYGRSVKGVISGANTVTPDPMQAINDQGNPYPVKTLTTEDYEQMLNGLGLLKPVVQAGNVITPPALLEGAAAAGSQAAQTVNKAGLNDAYVDLNPVSKGFVTLGEGVGMVFGVDLIKLGYDMRPKA